MKTILTTQILVLLAFTLLLNAQQSLPNGVEEPSDPPLTEDPMLRQMPAALEILRGSTPPLHIFSSDSVKARMEREQARLLAAGSYIAVGGSGVGPLPLDSLGIITPLQEGFKLISFKLKTSLNYRTSLSIRFHGLRDTLYFIVLDSTGAVRKLAQVIPDLDMVYGDDRPIERFEFLKGVVTVGVLYRDYQINKAVIGSIMQSYGSSYTPYFGQNPPNFPPQSYFPSPSIIRRAV